MSRTDFLFATPTFVSGFARNIDLFGVYDQYHQSATPQEADARAIASDWAMVGADLGAAIARFPPPTEPKPEAEEQLDLVLR